MLSKTADEIRVRLTELEPLVAEQQRLKTALGALESLIDQDGHRPEPSPEVEWIGLVAVSLSLLTLTGGGGGKAHSGYSLADMITFEGIAVGVGALLVVSHLIERIPVQRGVLLGIAAGLGFGISDVAIKALSGDLDSGPVGLLSPWSVVIVTAAVFSAYASARSLQIGDGVAVIAVTSVGALLCQRPGAATTGRA